MGIFHAESSSAGLFGGPGSYGAIDGTNLTASPRDAQPSAEYSGETSDEIEIYAKEEYIPGDWSFSGAYGGSVWIERMVFDWALGHDLPNFPRGGGDDTPDPPGGTPGGTSGGTGPMNPYPKGPLGNMCENEHMAWCDSAGHSIAKGKCEAQGLELTMYWCEDPKCQAGHPTHWEVAYVCRGTLDPRTFRRHIGPDLQ